MVAHCSSSTDRSNFPGRGGRRKRSVKSSVRGGLPDRTSSASTPTIRARTRDLCGFDATLNFERSSPPCRANRTRTENLRLHHRHRVHARKKRDIHSTPADGQLGQRGEARRRRHRLHQLHPGGFRTTSREVTEPVRRSRPSSASSSSTRGTNGPKETIWSLIWNSEQAG